eukprot:TRINITY_DN9857_c0_g1_i1.p1 TRINITY_DN9857_c0_g1~~TRINITY_DN9857_c0_g1_i1.p1  ORF type:complete len:313 (+),score=58.57 TRINITY_DN9857_c0_g1_i1:527-1465(+)
MSNEARGLIVSRNPVCRETFLSFKAYVSENVQNGHCNKKRKQIRVLADALTPDARKLLAENIKEENAEVRFYRTCKPHEGCSARFTTFQLQPHIKIDDLKSSFVPRPPKGDAATRARNINEAAFVAQELKPFSKAEPVKKSSEMYHVLDSMLKLQQLTTITADTPFESFEAVQQIVASSTEPYFSYTEFIEAVQKIPFRAVNHSFTLPYISTYKSKDKLNCEWERVYMLFEEEGVSRDIVCTALKASLQKDALSLLRYVMTGIAVRAVCVSLNQACRYLCTYRSCRSFERVFPTLQRLRVINNNTAQSYGIS